MSDAVLQELIVRLASDEEFAGSVQAEPSTLDAFDLTADERATLLALGADSGAGAAGLAERQSKSSLFFTGAGHHVEGHVNLTGHAPTTGEHTFTGPITHDWKLHDSLGAGKVHDAGLDASKSFDVGDKVHGLGADKWHDAGISAAKMTDVGDKVLDLGADKMAGLNGDG